MRREEVMIPIIRGLVRRPRLTRLAFSRDPWGNPFDAEVVHYPYDYVRRMWDDGPVSYSTTFRRWFVVGYDECQLVANHPEATAGTGLQTMLDHIRPYRQLAPDSKAFLQDWMLVRDGAEHHRIRTLVSAAFTPRRVMDLEPVIEQAAARAWEGIDTTGPVDIVSAFNRPIPFAVICHLLGVPTADRDWIEPVVADMATFFDPFTKFDAVRVDAAIARFRGYFTDLANERRRAPRDDLLTALTQATADDDRLTDDELAANAALLIFAGHDTTTNVLGNALVALAANPDQRMLVRDRPELWPNAVEELLRYDTTAVAILREATVDIEVGGVTIPAGDPITLQLNAANRDPRRWDDPYALVLDRPDPRPISFGHGAHHCLGHALARLELRILLQSLIERLGEYAVDDVEWRMSPNLRGPTRVVVDPAPTTR